MIFHFYPRTFSLFLSYERYLLYKGGWGYGEGGRGGEGVGGGGGGEGGEGGVGWR